ncbi:MAG: hypothetical protein AAFO74_14825 [Pseudomonadota bacterium]
MNNTTLQDDLAYVRDLAEAGQQAPLLGGRFLAFWGTLTTIAYFLHYSMEVGMFGWPDTAYAWIWGSFIIVGIIGQSALVYTIRNKPGGNSVGNRSEGTVWMAGGFALFAYFGTLIVKSFFVASPAPGFETSLPIVFAIYGTGLITSGIMGGVKTLTYAGFGALAMVALAIWFDGTDFTWAIASLGAFLTVLIPGLVLMRDEPKNVI